MQLVPPMDAFYLWGESGTSPTHVVSLQIFRPPADAPADLLENLYREMTDASRLKPDFRLRPHRSASTGGQFSWVEDDEIDMTVQVQRVGLPAPGRIRELLEHVSTFHAVRLDRDRPLWQAHLVEGLSDGRFALCVKMHHSMFDGITMGRHLQSGLSTDPANRSGGAPWMVPAPSAEPRRRPKPDVSIIDQLRTAVEVPTKMVSSTVSLVGSGIASLKQQRVAYPFSAPMTILNGSVSSSRRFAGQSWSGARIRALAGRVGVSSNDIGLAMCAGALRSYLLELDALPDSSLVALVPISLRPKDEVGAPQRGNNWGAILCSLGTDIVDPAERLAAINKSMTRSKTLMSKLDPTTSMLVSATNMGGAVLNLVPGLPKAPRAPFNLIISNVPIATERFYLNGCELSDTYGASVVTDGQALNITLSPYAGDIAFNITGCRRSVPHLQRLLTYLDEALTSLEEALPS